MFKKTYMLTIGLLLAGCDSGPKDTAYYLNNESERREMLSRCETGPFNFSNQEGPAPEDCNNAKIAQTQLNIYKMTSQQDSKEYFFNNPNIRENVIEQCMRVQRVDDFILPCANAFNTEKEIRVNVLKRLAKGIEKVEDFVKDKNHAISQFITHCRMNEPYLNKETICVNVKEADRQVKIINLEKMTGGKNDIEFFLANPNVLRDVYGYCDFYSKVPDVADLIKDHPICKNATIAAKNY